MGSDSDRIVIRDATRNDAADIGRLFVGTDSECFVPAFGTAEAMGKYVRRTFDGDGFYSARTVRVAEADGQVAGICVTYSDLPTDSPKSEELGIDGLSGHFDDSMASQSDSIAFSLEMGYDAYLDCLSVDGRFRRQGVGRALVADAVARHRSLLLYCRDDNEGAMRLYREAGFHVVGMTFGISEDSDGLGPTMLIMACGDTRDEQGAEG